MNGEAGKGDSPRPRQISYDQYASNWDRAFPSPFPPVAGTPEPRELETAALSLPPMERATVNPRKLRKGVIGKLRVCHSS